jgi:hypothetical protein
MFINVHSQHRFLESEECQSLVHARCSSNAVALGRVYPCAGKRTGAPARKAYAESLRCGARQMVSLALVPSVEQLEAASEEELCAFLGTLPHFPGVGAKARPIVVSVHKAHLRADLVTSRAKSRLMLALVAQLSVLLDQIAAYDAEIERRFRAHPAPIPRPSRAHPDAPLCTSLPGAGRRLAPRRLAGWRDDRSRYASAQSVQGRARACKGVQGRAGTAPVAIQSGRHVTARQRRAGIKPLRTALSQFAALPVCLGINEGGLGAGRLSAQAAARQESQCGRARLGQPLGATHPCHLAQPSALRSADLPGCPAGAGEGLRGRARGGTAGAPCHTACWGVSGALRAPRP